MILFFKKAVNMVNFIGKDWQINNINTVLFDKDGTFLNDHKYWGKLAECRINKIIKHFNLDEKLFTELCFAIGHNPIKCKLIKNGPVGVLSRNEVVDFMVNELKKYNVSTDFQEISDLFDIVHKEFSQNIENFVESLEYSEDFIKKLKEKGLKLAVVTSDNYEHTLKILKILNLEKMFDCVIGKDSCKKEKRTGEPALLALKEMNSKKEETIVIGDALMDYEMGKNAGLKGEILVATGQTDIEDLQKCSKCTVNNLNEVEIK